MITYAWKNYLFQTLLAILTIFIVILILSIEEAVIISSLGSTIFIIFAMPRGVTAEPRNIIGGYLAALLSGSICSLIHPSFLLHSIGVYSLAVGLSLIIMVVTDTEYPPASGAALGIVMRGFSLSVTIAVITSVTIISLAHYFLKPFLKDLT